MKYVRPLVNLQFLSRVASSTLYFSYFLSLSASPISNVLSVPSWSRLPGCMWRQFAQNMPAAIATSPIFSQNKCKDRWSIGKLLSWVTDSMNITKLGILLLHSLQVEDSFCIHLGKETYLARHPDSLDVARFTQESSRALESAQVASRPIRAKGWRSVQNNAGGSVNHSQQFFLHWKKPVDLICSVSMFFPITTPKYFFWKGLPIFQWSGASG